MELYNYDLGVTEHLCMIKSLENTRCNSTLASAASFLLRVAARFILFLNQNFDIIFYE